MFQGKRKALTFSFDDGVLQDERLIQIINKYDLKSTFNLNSELFGRPGEVTVSGQKVNHTKVNPEDVRRIYTGHEIAAHTLTHPMLPQCDNAEVIRQVEEDRKRLTEFAGYEVYGMAYPGGGVNNDERVAELIKNHTKIKYARTITSTYSFELQDNLYRFNPTVHYIDWDNVERLVKEFIDAKPDRPALFYIWGHSYELDARNEWDAFEDVCKDLCRREDIFYGTNSEVFFGK